MASAFPYPAGATVLVPLALDAGGGSAPLVESTVKASPAAIVIATMMRRIGPQVFECGMTYCSASGGGPMARSPKWRDTACRRTGAALGDNPRIRSGRQARQKHGEGDLISPAPTSPQFETFFIAFAKRRAIARA